MGEQLFLSDSTISDFGLRQEGLYLYSEDMPMYFIVPIPCKGGYYVREVFDNEV